MFRQYWRAVKYIVVKMIRPQAEERPFPAGETVMLAGDPTHTQTQETRLSNKTSCVAEP